MISNLEFYTQPNYIESEGFQTSTIRKKNYLMMNKIGKKRKKKKTDTKQEIEHFSGHEYSHQND